MFTINLTTNKELSKDDVKKWYRLVKQCVPDGIVTSTQILLRDPKEFLHDVKLIHNFSKNKHVYKIPLTRNLLQNEVEYIKEKWKGEGVISSSGEKINSVNDKSSNDNSIQDFKTLNNDIAKMLHNKWLDKKKKEGWSYNVRYSAHYKTHPLIRPWEELSDELKDVDYSLASDILGVFLNYLKKKNTNINRQ